MNKLKLLYAFYKSTLTINLSASFLLTILTLAVSISENWGTGLGGLLVNFVQSFLLVFLTAGFLISIIYKELTYKEEYYFYYNRGVGRVKLFLFCVALNLLFYILARLIL